MSAAKAKKPKPIDQRLARIYGLIDDLWGSDFSVEIPLTRMFDDVDWGSVEPKKVKRIMAILFEPATGNYDDPEPLREKLSTIADEEHREICACCRTHMTTIGRAA